MKVTQVKSSNGARREQRETLRSPNEVAELRGLTVAEVLGVDGKGEADEAKPAEPEATPAEVS